MGLEPEHHGELNRVGVSRERFSELRGLYAGNEKALRQIDVYDPETEYHMWFARFRDAIKGRDAVAEQEALEWFRENGYIDL